MEMVSTWYARIGGAMLMVGVACAGGGAHAAGLGAAGLGAAGLGAALPGARPASAAIQPVYWVRDRFGRRVWVEHHYHRPPPPPRFHHRHGWVDRYGHWHPYR